MCVCVRVCVGGGLMAEYQTMSMNGAYENHMTCSEKERNAQFTAPPPF